MTINHAPPPQLCPTCLALLHTYIQAVPTETRRIMPCRHSQPGAVVVAEVAVDSGHVTSWALHGPLSEEEATLLAFRHVAATAPLGAHVEQAGMQ